MEGLSWRESPSQRRRRSRSAKIFLAVRRALSPETGTRNKTSPTADAFFERTASLKGLSSRRKSLLGFIRRPVAVALIFCLLGTVNHLISPNISRISEGKRTLLNGMRCEPHLCFMAGGLGSRPGRSVGAVERCVGSRDTKAEQPRITRTKRILEPGSRMRILLRPGVAGLRRTCELRRKMRRRPIAG